MTHGNDTRGWILTSLSGIACFLGAAVICVDILVRLIPKYRNFKIEDSNAFLSCSLGLSAGVMLFSSLYSMLPSSRKYLQDGGLSSKAAAWVLIAAFMVGVFGIQLLSQLLHHFMPHHAVDCDHSHEEDHEASDDKFNTSNNGMDDSSESTGSPHRHDTEQTPLLFRSMTDGRASEAIEHSNGSNTTPSLVKRPSLHSKVTGAVADLVAGRRSHCDGDGPCFGFSDPCSQECFKTVAARGGRLTSRNSRLDLLDARYTDPESGLLHRDESVASRKAPGNALKVPNDEHSDHHGLPSASIAPDDRTARPASHAPNQTHHHHVPTNAFLSISLQTSIAIALHKLPEGFITYATNHANPSLGFSVFIALFIHNITEGFALALPIYLATSSRLKALSCSFVLGGLSQPLGAGVAAAWLAIAERRRGAGNVKGTVGEEIYGIMFALTAGIMACVALSLFREGLELSHNRGACTAFAFVGMGILGISMALNA